MTYEQWYFEFGALKQRELEENKQWVERTKATLDAQREMMSSILGLKFPVPDPDDPEKVGEPLFVPASLLFSDPNLLQETFKRLRELGIERQATAQTNAGFDELSKQIAAYLKDGTPMDARWRKKLIDDIEVRSVDLWNDPGMQQRLAAIGLTPMVAQQRLEEELFDEEGAAQDPIEDVAKQIRDAMTIEIPYAHSPYAEQFADLADAGVVQIDQSELEKFSSFFAEPAPEEPPSEQ